MIHIKETLTEAINIGYDLALTEHDKEIRDKILNLIEREKKVQEGWNEEDFSYAIIQSGINRLIELLTFIKEK